MNEMPEKVQILPIEVVKGDKFEIKTAPVTWIKELVAGVPIETHGEKKELKFGTK